MWTPAPANIRAAPLNPDRQVNWLPSAGLPQLQARAQLFQQIRDFFRDRQVLEVDTPLLCSAGVTDPAIEPLTVIGGLSVPATRYLQTSPEYAMKRLLAAGSGPIYQLGKAFRDGEAGRRHNPEFTMLEWYRPGFDHHQLMAEVAALMQHCLGRDEWRKVSYRELFQQTLDIDPFTAGVSQLRDCARSRIEVEFDSDDADLWLDLLMSHIIEPGLSGLCFVYDYPATQAALAQLRETEDAVVAERFELYIDGVELANGYHELGDARELQQRFERDNARRVANRQSPRPLDERFLAAMVAGMPACSGVALGVDRLLSIATGEADIRKLMPLAWDNC